MSRSATEGRHSRVATDHPRASSIGRMPDEVLREVAARERVESEIRTLLAQRLVQRGPMAELGHLALAAVTALLVWPNVPRTTLLGWIGAVALVTAFRSWSRGRLMKAEPDAAALFTNMRRGVVASGLVWAAGVLLFAPDLPFHDLAILLVIFVGLIAGAMSILAPDPVSFFGFVGTLVVPAAIAVLINGRDRSHLTAFVAIALFVVVMVQLFRRAYVELIEHLRTMKQLEPHSRQAWQDPGSESRFWFDVRLRAGRGAGQRHKLRIWRW